MRKTRSILASFDNHAQAKACVRGLRRVGLDVSFGVIAEPSRLPKRLASMLMPGTSVPRWTKLGLSSGVLVGLVLNTVVFPISHANTKYFTGPLASWLLAVIEWSIALGGCGAAVDALFLVCRRKAHVIHYQLTWECGKLLLIACGSVPAIAYAERSIMLSTAIPGGQGLSDHTRSFMPTKGSELKH